MNLLWLLIIFNIFYVTNNSWAGSSDNSGKEQVDVFGNVENPVSKIQSQNSNDESSDTTNSISPSSTIELDRLHAAALWHKLMKDEIDQDELLEISNINLSLYDEFAQRRKQKEAENYYKKLRSDLKVVREFIINETGRTLGEYDFKSKSFPLNLPEESTVSEWVDYANSDNVNKYNYSIEYDIPEDIRNISINEKSAEKLIPRITESGRQVVVILHLKSPKARLQNDVKTLKFDVSKVEVVLLGHTVTPQEAQFSQITGQVFNGVKTPRSTKNIVLMTWVHGKNEKKYSGPMVAGNWKGSYETESLAAKFTIVLQQSRSILTGNMHVVNLENGQNADENDVVVSGTLSKDGKFQLKLGDPGYLEFNGTTNPDDINALNGHCDNFASDNGDFKMIREDASNDKKNDTEDESVDSSINNLTPTSESDQDDDSTDVTPLPQPTSIPTNTGTPTETSTSTFTISPTPTNSIINDSVSQSTSTPTSSSTAMQTSTITNITSPSPITTQIVNPVVQTTSSPSIMSTPQVTNNFITTSTPTVFAFSGQSIVYLQDGSIIHGNILEMTGGNLKIKDNSGDILTFQMTNVLKVVNATQDDNQQESGLENGSSNFNPTTQTTSTPIVISTPSAS